MRDIENRKVFTGTVVSDKMDKTVAVQIERLIRHPIYERVVKRRKKFLAHDENNQCKVGDMVSIIETRPLSKNKRWKVFEVIKKVTSDE